MAPQWQIGDLLPDPGSSKGRWQIYRILKGGMGLVYIVYDHERHEPLAAKTFRDKHLAWQQGRDRFVQEAHTWINLDLHEHIARARFVEIIHGRPYIFLEYVSGGDLSRWIGSPRMTLEQALRFGIQFCYGMEYAYAKGIKAHRDVKPQNCLITEDKTLKITDFGLARVVVEQVEEGGPGGTPEYMPPEQWDNSEQVDERADIYSFGAMLFEMLTGRPPFGQRPQVSVRELERRHKEKPAPSIDTPHSTLNSIVQACLQKGLDQRCRCFSEVRERLAHVLERLTGEKVSVPMGGMELRIRDLNNKGSSLNYLKKYSEAVSVLEEALQRIVLEHVLEGSPHHSMVWNNKGFALMHLGRRGGALTCFDTALAIDPMNFRALTNKGHLLFESGRLSDALECHEHSLSIEPNSSLVWNNKGRTLYAREAYSDAWSCYEKALQIDPRNTFALGNLGLMLREMGRHKEALVWFDKALSIDSSYYDEVLNEKALSLTSCDRHEEALVCIDKALKVNPQNAVLWQNRGNILFHLKQYREALDAFDNALELDPGRKIARQGRATCRVMLQQEAKNT